MLLLMLSGCLCQWQPGEAASKTPAPPSQGYLLPFAELTLWQYLRRRSRVNAKQTPRACQILKAVAAGRKAAAPAGRALPLPLTA